MTNPWQAWLQACTQACDNATQSQNPLLTAYTQGWQQWSNATANAWQTPSEFWQTVAAIQTARAQSISQFWQQQPQQFAALIGCQGIPQACGQLTQWAGSNAIQAINLAVTTQAYRANLWQQWSRNLQPAQPQTFTAPTTTSLWAETGTTKAASRNEVKTNPQGNATPQPAQPATQPAPQSASKAVNTPAESNATSPWHMQSHYPTQHITQSSAPATAKPQPVAKPVVQQPAAAVAQHQEAMPLMNGTTGLSHPTTSSTANSVMRANGSTLTSAAAAARRSVVARRATGRRRSVPRTVR